MTMMEVEGIIKRETVVLGVYHSANISWMFLQAISQIRECGYQIISSAFQAEHHRFLDLPSSPLVAPTSIDKHIPQFADYC